MRLVNISHSLLTNVFLALLLLSLGVEAKKKKKRSENGLKIILFLLIIHCGASILIGHLLEKKLHINQRAAV